MAHEHAHHSHHDHSHAPEVSAANERKVLISLILIATFMVVEVAGGLISGSLALIADAGHMLTDAAALALAYVAFRLGRRAADQRRTFGYARLEVVAGFVNALTLFAIIFWILYEAWQRFQEPYEILAGPMLGVAVAGLLVNVLVIWILTRGDAEHVNIRGALLHAIGDLLGSLGAVGAAIIIAYTGWTPIDPILSVLVALLILRSAWKLMKASLHILLEGAPEGVSAEAITAELGALPGVAGVRHVHVWSLTSGRALATLHVAPQNEAEARQVQAAVEDALRDRFGIDHATVAIDWGRGGDCPLADGEAHGHEHHGHDHARHAGCGHDHDAGRPHAHDGPARAEHAHDHDTADHVAEHPTVSRNSNGGETR